MLVFDAVPAHLWQRFVDGAALSASSQIASRWARVKALGADPEGLREAVHPAADLNARREQNAALRAAAALVLEESGPVLAARSVSLLLADAQAVVLDAWAGGSFGTEARRVRLIPGSDWSEAIRGTNAIGTGIAEARAVTVRGTAHWARPNHGLVCYASPVLDGNGVVIGLLDATTFAGAHDPVVSAAMLLAARAIEARLFASAREADPHLRSLGAVLRRLPEAALVVDADGKVLLASAAGRAVLRDGLGLGLDGRALIAASLAGHPVPCEARKGWTARVEPLDGGRHLLVVLSPGATPRRKTVAPPPSDPLSSVVGSDPKVVRLRQEARRFGRTDLPILLLSETGTGKEVLARALHRASSRAPGPFVPVNCGALSPSLLESELFGYAPGAFTGALKNGRDGRVATADGGTLFLDEIGEMPPALQALLLRFLEDGSYTRVGDVVERKADVRLVAATSRDLGKMVEEGRFRADLYYRVRVVRLGLPPLRERTDLPELAAHVLAELSHPHAPSPLSESAIAALCAHRWPGNVRELKNALRYALVVAEGEPVIGVEHLPEDLRVVAAPPAGTLEAVEVDAITSALASAGGNISRAARALGVARSTIYRVLERQGSR